jgi:hypothetical protein
MRPSDAQVPSGEARLVVLAGRHAGRRVDARGATAEPRKPAAASAPLYLRGVRHLGARPAVLLCPGSAPMPNQIPGAVRTAAGGGDRRLGTSHPLSARHTLWKSKHPATVCPQIARKRRFLSDIHRRGGSIVKITTLIIVSPDLATASGATVIVSVMKEPVLLACGGPNC